MKDNDIIKAIAELDGWIVDPRFMASEYARRGEHESMPYSQMTYLTSRDAIVPMIEKWCNADDSKDNDVHSRIARFTYALLDILGLKGTCISYGVYVWFDLLKATPRQLCEALLKAAGKWID